MSNARAIRVVRESYPRMAEFPNSDRSAALPAVPAATPGEGRWVKCTARRESAPPGAYWGIRPWRWSIALAALCLLPLLLASVGLDRVLLGTADDRGGAANVILDADLGQTLLAWTAVCLALFVGLLCLVQHQHTHDDLLPVVAVALTTAGALDAFRVLALRRLLFDVRDIGSFAATTWTAGSTLHATILLAGVTYLALGMPL